MKNRYPIIFSAAIIILSGAVTAQEPRKTINVSSVKADKKDQPEQKAAGEHKSREGMRGKSYSQLPVIPKDTSTKQNQRKGVK